MNYVSASFWFVCVKKPSNRVVEKLKKAIESYGGELYSYECTEDKDKKIFDLYLKVNFLSTDLDDKYKKRFTDMLIRFLKEHKLLPKDSK